MIQIPDLVLFIYGVLKKNFGFNLSFKKVSSILNTNTNYKRIYKLQTSHDNIRNARKSRTVSSEVGYKSNNGDRHKTEIVNEKGHIGMAIQSKTEKTRNQESKGMIATQIGDLNDVMNQMMGRIDSIERNLFEMNAKYMNSPVI